MRIPTALAAVALFAGAALAQAPARDDKSAPKAPSTPPTVQPAAHSAADLARAGLTIVAPWARATPGGAKVGAAFVEVRAAAGVADRIVAARSPVAGAVELHDHIKDGALMKMRRVDAITIAAGQTVKLQPGGFHVMLMELKGPLTAGESIRMTLVFEKAGAVEIDVPVAPIGAMGPPPPAGSSAGAGAGSGAAPGSGSGSGPGPKAPRGGDK